MVVGLQERKAGQVEKELDLVEEAVKSLEGICDTLFKRLVPVLSPEQTEPKGDDRAVPEQPLVPLAERVRKTRTAIISVKDAVRRVTERVEV